MRRLLLLLALLLTPIAADAAGSPAPFYGNVFGNTIPIANVLNGPYYATCNGSFDDAATIQSAINAAGQAATLQTPGRVFINGTCAIGSTITVAYSNVYIEGTGDGFGGGSPRAALKWVGASGGTMLQYVPASGKIERGGVRGIMFDSSFTAGYGLKVDSVEGGDFEEIAGNAFSTVFIEVGYVSGQTGTLHTAFKNITWSNYSGNTGGGIWLNGAEVNNFENLLLGVGFGAAIQFGGGPQGATGHTADFNYFLNVHVVSSGSSVTFGQSTAAIAAGSNVTVPVTMSAAGTLAAGQVVVVNGTGGMGASNGETVTALAGTTSSQLVANFAKAHPEGSYVNAYASGASPYTGTGVLFSCGGYSNIINGLSTSIVYSQGPSTCSGHDTPPRDNGITHLDRRDDGLFPPIYEAGATGWSHDDGGSMVYNNSPTFDFGGRAITDQLSATHPYNSVMSFGAPGTGECPIFFGNDAGSGAKITFLCGDGGLFSQNGIRGTVLSVAQYASGNAITVNEAYDVGANSIHLTGGACLNGVQIGSSYIYSSTGAPACTPPASAHSMFIRTDGTTGSDLYIYNGTAWNAVAGV